MNDEKKDFLLCEYQDLRKQIDTLMDETNLMAKYALILTGIIWTWLATKSKPEINAWAEWIPLIVTIILGIRVIGLNQEVVKIGKFIAEIEKEFDLDERLGWELKLLAERGSGEVRKMGNYRFQTALFFWIILLAATIIIPMIFQIK